MSLLKTFAEKKKEKKRIMKTQGLGEYLYTGNG